MTAAVYNHSVENSRDTLSKSHYARAACTSYVVKKTWPREDVIVAAFKAFFHLQRKQILSLGVFWLL